MKLPHLVRTPSAIAFRIPGSPQPTGTITPQSHSGSVQIRCTSECGQGQSYRSASSEWITIQRNRNHPSSHVDYSQYCDYDELDAEIRDACEGNEITHSLATRSRR